MDCNQFAPDLQSTTAQALVGGTLLEKVSRHFDFFWPVMMDCAEKIENDIKNMSMYVSVSHLFTREAIGLECS